MSDCKYPNLAKYIHWSFTSYCSFAEHAGMTEALLRKVLVGQAEIYPDEIYRIHRMTLPGFTPVPFSVFMCRKPILLDKKRYRHRVMMDKLQRRFEAARADSTPDSAGTVEGIENRLKVLLEAFQDRPVYYTAYLATVDAVETLELHNSCRHSRERLRRE